MTIKHRNKKIIANAFHLQYDLDLPSANDARVLVCYCAVRHAVRGADGPRLSTARSKRSRGKISSVRMRKVHDALRTRCAMLGCDARCQDAMRDGRMRCAMAGCDARWQDAMRDGRMRC